MTPKQIIDPTPGGAPPSISQAIRVGDTVYVSGQVAFGANGEIVGVGDAAAQAEQCFKNLAAVLEAGGASLSDVVKLTNYFTSADYFPAYRDVKQRLFPKDPPASTSVVVAALLHPDFMMEVEAVAIVGGGGGGETS